MAIGKIWRDTGWFHSPKSATEVMESIARVGTHSTAHRFAWRGHADADWAWESSLQRYLGTPGAPATEARVRSAEEKILNEARDRGLGVVGGSHLDDLQLLTDLQHYGIPTRLVDVTSNPATALWFATKSAPYPPVEGKKTREKGGLLIAMNMDWYKKSDTKTTTVFSTAPIIAKSPHAQLERALKLDTPFAVGSSLPNDRLRAQEGYFISSAIPSDPQGPLLGMQSKPFSNGEKLIQIMFNQGRFPGKPPHIPFIAIYIRPNIKLKLRHYLKYTYSRTSKTLFPDYSGMRDYGEWRQIMNSNDSG